MLSAGKVTATGLYRIILDSEGSFLIHKPTGNQVKFREKGYTFCLKTSDIQAVASIAPVDAEMRNPLLENAEAQPRLPPILEESPAVDASRPDDAPGLRAWSGVEAMRSRLKLLQDPIYGTKDQLWSRLLQYEGHAKKEQGLKMQLAEELEARRAAREGTERAAIPLDRGRSGSA